MNLKNFLIKNIIAPHGITDLTHSVMNNNYEKLFEIQKTTLIFSEIVTNFFHANTFYDLLFFAATSYHFRNDFKNVFIEDIKIPKIITSVVFIGTCISIDKIIPFEIGSDLLILFMSFIHVPNHYRNNWKHIQKDPVFSYLVIFIFTCFINGATNFNEYLIFNEQLLIFFKSIIISHIIYSEKYVE